MIVTEIGRFDNIFCEIRQALDEMGLQCKFVVEGILRVASPAPFFFHSSESDKKSCHFNSNPPSLFLEPHVPHLTIHILKHAS